MTDACCPAERPGADRGTRARARQRLPLALAVLGGLAGGCAPDLGARPEPIGVGALASQTSLAAPATAWPADAWWHGYGDPQLDALEAEALAGAPDLRAAAARAARADAAAQEAGAALAPEVSVNARPEAIRQSRNLGYPDFVKDDLPRGIHSQGRLTLDLAYDLDLFGRNRAARAAASSDAQAAAADIRGNGSS